ncbi:hypothetical protein SUNI508_11528 [Seiridium unicorne]|uniref:Ankyrin n=1 Tax=Seiridium unicorne TaxID=138068 RepID=A0ABR2UHD9_9PEZI
MTDQSYDHAPLIGGPRIPLIFIAALMNEYEEVCFLIAQNVDVNAVNPNTGATALHMAGSLENGRIVQKLLAAGADFSVVNGNNETPMHEAAIGGNFEAVKLLIEAGASASGRGRGGASPLHMAAWNGHINVLKLLIDTGVDIHAVDHDGQAPLHVAASHGAGPETLQVLLEAGSDINARSNTGETPLLKAGGYGDMVAMLIQEGADLKIASNDGMTALHTAAKEGVREQVELILDTKAFDVKLKTADGMTPLHFAASKWYSEDITPFLLDAGADVDDVDNDGNTALHLASQAWCDNVVKVLLDRGAAKDKRNNMEETALHVAARMGMIEPVRSLLQAGADFQVVDGNGLTPKQSAETGKEEQVRTQTQQWAEEGPHSEERNGQVRDQILKSAERHRGVGTGTALKHINAKTSQEGEVMEREVPLLERDVSDAKVCSVARSAPSAPCPLIVWDMPGIQYYPEDPRIQQLNQACTDSAFEEFQRLLTEWCAMENPSPPHGPAGYPLGTVEPSLYHAIRMDRPTFVAYLLDIGLRLGRLAAWEASEHKCSPRMWQVFVDHGHFDISAPMEDFGLSPLGYVLDDEKLVEWFLAQGADPNAESQWGLTPFLKAVGHSPLSTVKLLHTAGGSAVNSVPFVCSPYPPLPQRSDVTPESRLEVLRYLLDAGADPNARKWAHNGKGYASDFDWGIGLNDALANGRLELAEELLRRGARTDVPTCNIASQGETAIALATRYMPALLPLVEECRARWQGQ